MGHSNHTLDVFLALLMSHHIEVVVDVRSSPYSRYAAWFNREPLTATLENRGIRYLFMGDTLGGVPESDDFYDAEGHLLYDRLAASGGFSEGIDRLIAGASRYCISLMCSEEHPENCYRNELLGELLSQGGIEVVHIRGTGAVELRRGRLIQEQMTLECELEEPMWRSTQAVGSN